ncbi:uncharacterized protein RHIMIDRAFT_118142 [Rhizopus microsporus ATCC 52813]|uniref:Uncharacterized protein n=1 Tax=Rhizopus microsporus ATCC 52813 TaxID=1340429 RepID=A0A2G4T048_RHIZD|nr:uncharacterized protein RHIMIDRAFT_118142 [Rhizopus microsporus ATCC 52813]PHZ14405.1 hypothetical protein RHIMIDRAFT_118142 [Rhizopus microsporus ATCC 52813]
MVTIKLNLLHRPWNPLTAFPPWKLSSRLPLSYRKIPTWSFGLPGLISLLLQLFWNTAPSLRKIFFVVLFQILSAGVSYSNALRTPFVPTIHLNSIRLTCQDPLVASTLNCMISSIVSLVLLGLLTGSPINWFTVSGIWTLLVNDLWSLSRLFTSFCTIWRRTSPSNVLLTCSGVFLLLVTLLPMSLRTTVTQKIVHFEAVFWLLGL